jgi:hypothetical protein
MQTQLSLTNTQLELMETTPLVLDLTLPPTSPTLSTKCPSTPPRDSCQMALPSKPRKLSMRFRSPMKQSLGMLTASAWHREQLLEACRKLDLRNRSRLSKGMIPVQSPLTTMTTLASVPSVPANEPTAFAHLTPRIRHHHPYLSPLDPHHPGAWDKLSSIMSKQRRWSLNLPLPSTRTVKIPLRFRGKENHPPNTPQNPGESNQDSPHKESRFWTYLLEDVKTEDVGDPSQYVTLDQVLTCTQLRQMREQGEIPSLHHLRDTKSTGGLTISHATSSTISGGKSRPDSSDPI